MRAVTLVEVIVSIALISAFLPLAISTAVQFELATTSIARDAAIIETHLRLHDKLQSLSQVSSEIIVSVDGIDFSGAAGIARLRFTDGIAHIEQSGASTIHNHPPLSVSLVSWAGDSEVVRITLSWKIRVADRNSLPLEIPITLSTP